MKFRILGIVTLLFIALGAFGVGRYFDLSENYGLSSGKTVVRIGSSEVAVEVARTPPEKAKGLSGRAALSVGEGMLFVFGGSRRYSFWMRGMLFPIDIIWIDENKEIVDITYDARPESYPFQFQPRYPAQYVLEVQSGWAQSRGIQIGDVVEFSL